MTNEARLRVEINTLIELAQANLEDTEAVRTKIFDLLHSALCDSHIDGYLSGVEDTKDEFFQ